MLVNRAAGCSLISMESVFLVYTSRGIVNSPDLKKMILTEFNLPLACSTKTLTEAMAKIDVNHLRRLQ